MKSTRNSELRAAARQSLSGRWTTAVLVTLLYMILASVFSSPVYARNYASLISVLLYILVLYPIVYGYCVFALNVSRGEGARVGTLFEGFDNWGRVVLTGLLRSVYIFLWTLLLVVPGIIKSYSYAMTMFVLRDNPHMSADEAITESMHLMSGHKWKLFRLDLSFIGWICLGVITFGIGFLWISPYMAIARAKFYDDLKSNRSQSEL